MTALQAPTDLPSNLPIHPLSARGFYSYHHTGWPSQMPLYSSKKTSTQQLKLLEGGARYPAGHNVKFLIFNWSIRYFCPSHFARGIIDSPFILFNSFFFFLFLAMFAWSWRCEFALHILLVLTLLGEISSRKAHIPIKRFWVMYMHYLREHLCILT